MDGSGGAPSRMGKVSQVIVSLVGIGLCITCSSNEGAFLVFGAANEGIVSLVAQRALHPVTDILSRNEFASQSRRVAASHIATDRDELASRGNVRESDSLACGDDLVCTLTSGGEVVHPPERMLEFDGLTGFDDRERLGLDGSCRRPLNLS